MEGKVGVGGIEVMLEVGYILLDVRTERSRI